MKWVIRLVDENGVAFHGSFYAQYETAVKTVILGYSEYTVLCFYPEEHGDRVGWHQYMYEMSTNK